MLHGGLDHPALLRGIVVAAIVAVPAGVIAQFVGDSDSRPGWFGTLLFLVALAGLAAGGYVAARDQRRGTPLTHGILASVTTFAVVEAVGIVRRLITSTDISWSRIASSLLLSLIAGTIGGLLGMRRARRPHTTRGAA
jgi:putative membrane protein (TIGR04086 family)